MEMLGSNKVVAEVTKEERDSMMLIQTKLSCSEQARWQIPPEKEFTKDEITAYVAGAINSLAEAKFLETLWWMDIQSKYGLTRVDAQLNFDTRELWVRE